MVLCRDVGMALDNGGGRLSALGNLVLRIEAEMGCKEAEMVRLWDIQATQDF